MKLKLKETPEQVELIKALGSKNPTEAAQAAEAFAAFIAPVAQKVHCNAHPAWEEIHRVSLFFSGILTISIIELNDLPSLISLQAQPIQNLSAPSFFAILALSKTSSTATCG